MSMIPLGVVQEYLWGDVGQRTHAKGVLADALIDAGDEESAKKLGIRLVVRYVSWSLTARTIRTMIGTGATFDEVVADARRYFNTEPEADAFHEGWVDTPSGDGRGGCYRSEEEFRSRFQADWEAIAAEMFTDPGQAPQPTPPGEGLHAAHNALLDLIESEGPEMTNSEGI